MIQAVIFDMDGLLIDSEPLQSLAVARVIKMYGKKPIVKANGLIHTIGLKGNEQWAELALTHGIAEDIEVLREKRRRAYIDIVKEKKVKAMPGARKLLRMLKRKHIKLGLASNTTIKHIVIILDKIQISDYFGVVISADFVQRAKPHPDIYIKTAEELKLKTSECLVLEDSETGVLAAKKAGMFVVAVPSIYTRHQDFSEADAVLPSLEKVTWEFIKKLG